MPAGSIGGDISLGRAGSQAAQNPWQNPWQVVVASEERAMTEQEATARGVIRREEMPFLSEYGTAYVLYDEQDANYSYAIKSDQYRFSEYVGLQAKVSGPLTDVGRELAVMNVTN